MLYVTILVYISSWITISSSELRNIAKKRNRYLAETLKFSFLELHPSLVPYHVVSRTFKIMSPNELPETSVPPESLQTVLDRWECVASVTI